MKKLIVHLGAHKTGSTFIQNILKLNLNLLEQNEINYPTLNQLRDNGISKTIKRNAGINELKNKFLKVTHKSARKFILSEENLLGSAGEVYHKKTLYQDFANPLKKVIKTLNPVERKALLIIRSYDSFFSSLYCEFLRHSKKHFTFQEYIEGFNLEDFSWNKVLSELAFVFEQDNVIVCDYDAFRNNNFSVFEFLLGKEIALKLEFPEKQIRPSFLNKTIEMVDSIAENFTREEAAILRDPINRNLLKLDNEYKKYNAFSTDISQKLKAKYQAELVEIYSKYNTLSA